MISRKVENMTTGHYNPAYGDIVSRFRHLQTVNSTGALPSNDNLKKMTMRMDPTSLDEIRRKAREAWSYPKVMNETSYMDHYRDRNLDVDEPTQARPTDPERKHKPHPSE